MNRMVDGERNKTSSSGFGKMLRSKEDLAAQMTQTKQELCMSEEVRGEGNYSINNKAVMLASNGNVEL